MAHIKNTIQWKYPFRHAKQVLIFERNKAALFAKTNFSMSQCPKIYKYYGWRKRICKILKLSPFHLHNLLHAPTKAKYEHLWIYIERHLRPRWKMLREEYQKQRRYKRKLKAVAKRRKNKEKQRKKRDLPPIPIKGGAKGTRKSWTIVPVEILGEETK